MYEWALTTHGEFGTMAAHGERDGNGHWETYKFDFPAPITAQLEFGKLSLWCGSERGGGGWNEFRITRDPRIHLDLRQPLSLLELERGVLKPLQYFFTFAADSWTNVRSMTLYPTGPRPTRLLRQPKDSLPAWPA